ncbi:hypothetical protein DERF_014798 [Dermatophagoides farinae]|uniref:Uncharacterized protein n=1 Tax=Dermatophagoides farinae TaxID=6954 RepID=A0A922KV42_DERFA|nr:hypothetical protein DERF_014798 [Dermatophagoides farinae]
MASAECRLVSDVDGMADSFDAGDGYDDRRLNDRGCITDFLNITRFVSTSLPSVNGGGTEYANEIVAGNNMAITMIDSN